MTTRGVPVRAPRAERPARRAARAAALATPPRALAAPRPSPPSTHRHLPRRQVARAPLPRLLYCQRMLHCRAKTYCQRLLHCRARTYVAPISGTCALLHEIGTFDALGALSADDVRARARPHARAGARLGAAAGRLVAQSGIKLI